MGLARWKNTSSARVASGSPSTRQACSTAAGSPSARTGSAGARPSRIRHLQAQVRLALAGREALPARGLQRVKRHIIMSRAVVLNIPRATLAIENSEPDSHGPAIEIRV